MVMEGLIKWAVSLCGVRWWRWWCVGGGAGVGEVSEGRSWLRLERGEEGEGCECRSFWSLVGSGSRRVVAV